MITKRTLWILMIFVLSLGLAACGGSDAPAATDAVEAENTSTDVSALPVEIDVRTVADIKNQDDVFMLDVREQWEYDEGHLPGIALIPMGEIPNRLSELPKDKEIVLTCRSGNRSGQVAAYLEEAGYTNVHNMQGGILAWQAAGYDVEQ